MKKMYERILRWWYFHLANPVVRRGEHGGFKWVFRRFWLEISTASGNFEAKFMADEHPYAYLLVGKTDDNIIGFCQMVYMVSHLITVDPGVTNDVRKALDKYLKRAEKNAKVVEDDFEEKVALETEKKIQEHIELPKKERRKAERDINKRYRKAVKKAQEKAGEA